MKVFAGPSAVACFAFAAGVASAQAPAVTWDVRDVDHPIMGAITVAVPQSGVTTNANGVKIVSAAFVSCEKATHTLAIELANSTESDTRGGLQPVEMPRLVCNARVNGTPVRTEVTARWSTNELGDTLARGLSPAELRKCGAIDVQQNVVMPVGSATLSQRLAMTLSPGDAGLAPVFAACEGPVVNAPAPLPQRPTMAAAPVPRAAAPATPAPTPATSKAAAADSSWKSARTLPSGKTNVRATPRIDGAVVTQLHPGTPLLAQKAEGDWWRVKPTKGTGFAGFIRGDRLAFE